MKLIENLINQIAKAPMSIHMFAKHISKLETFYSDLDLQIQLMIANGLEIYIENEMVYLQTSKRNLEDQTFCIVDIETNGNNVTSSQIIELGAIKYKNGKIIDTYETLIYTKEIPEYITQVTGITPNMTINAPPLRVVLEEFKIFLDTDVFVAHNVNFDYKYISESMKLFNFGELYNRKLCTIDLSKKLIQAPKYGLEALKEVLNIQELAHHRALDDAKSSLLIFEHCLELLPPHITSTEALIAFSKEAKALL